MIDRISKRSYFIALIVSWLVFVIFFVVLRGDVETIRIETNDQSPIVCADKYQYGDLSDFSYSPDKKYIAFVDDVFRKPGGNWNTYWGIKVMDVSTREEKTLLVTDSHLSDYNWISTTTIRVLESLGTGVRGFRDVSVEIPKPDSFEDYVKSGRATEFWTPDETYSDKLHNDQLAREFYYKR